MADNDPGSKASSPTEQKSQIDFQFLNFSHPSEAKASRARRTVRSHVTRQQHQREHAAAAARRAKSVPQPDVELEQGPSQIVHAATFPPNRPTLELPTRPGAPRAASDASSQSPSPTGSPMRSAESRIDPYEVYPQEWHPYLQTIMVHQPAQPNVGTKLTSSQDHYVSNMAVDIPDLDGPDAKGLLRSRFFPFCLTDLASLHAVMLVAASNYGNVRGSRSHTIDVLQLRGMAISKINKALEDSSRATSDQLIAAVALMAKYEALFGDRSIFNTHMTGLLRMVSLRGGLPSLGLDGLLERMLLWIDSNASHITGTHMYFDKAAFPSTVQHPRPDPHRFGGGVLRQPSA